MPEDQYTTYNSETMKAASKHIAKIPYLKETFAAKPALLEHFLLGYTSNFGRMMLRSMDDLLAIGRKMASDGTVPVTPKKTAADFPVIDAFRVRYPTAHTRSIERFYDEYEKAKQEWGSFRFKNIPAGLDLTIEMPEPLRTYHYIALQMNAVRDGIQRIKQDEELGAEEKRDAIDTLYMVNINMARVALDDPQINWATPTRNEPGKPEDYDWSKWQLPEFKEILKELR